MKLFCLGVSVGIFVAGAVAVDSFMLKLIGMGLAAGLSFAACLIIYSAENEDAA